MVEVYQKSKMNYAGGTYRCIWEYFTGDDWDSGNNYLGWQYPYFDNNHEIISLI